jgi:hypothetical protein
MGMNYDANLTKNLHLLKIYPTNISKKQSIGFVEEVMFENL